MPTTVRTDTWDKTYICIDLKTFYASVECADRGLDPFTTNLVVADPSRGHSTICLAVSPAMKALGVRNRCRIFEIPDGIDYIEATPRMRHYMEVSAKIYGIYLEFVSAEDVHVYSIDECFIDATPYLKLYHTDAVTFARSLRDAVYARTHITATAGIGTNLFLAKVALDITAKHADDGIGILDEESFRDQIWRHRPITDIWGIGPGIAARLARFGAYDLMSVAALDEDLLYDEFGVNAEYLIDHAFGREPVTIAEIHAYRPGATSTSTGQVLARGYSYEEAYTVLREMVEGAVLDMVEKHAVCEQVALFVGYASETQQIKRLNASGTAQFRDNCGKVRGATSDTVPRSSTEVALPERAPRADNAAQARSGVHERTSAGNAWRSSEGRPRGGYAAAFAHSNASRKLPERTNSFKKLMTYFDELYARIVDPKRPVKRINLGFGNLLPEELATLDLFTDPEELKREHDLAETVIAVKGRYGKNALLRGTSLAPGATARERNQQVGGHRA